MDYDVLEGRYVGGYTIWLRFRDGTSGEIDLGPELRGGIFAPLRDVETFRRFVIDPEGCSIVWANGASFAPEFLHDNVRVTT